MNARHQLLSARYAAMLPETTCEPCARERMVQMDDFVLHSWNVRRHQTDETFTNPFLAGWAKAAEELPGNQVIAADRQSLVTPDPFQALCLEGCRHSLGDGEMAPPEALTNTYRRPLESFFASGPTLTDLVNPVAGPLAPAVDVDLTSAVTAKASGYFVCHTPAGDYVRPWGGHENSNRTATLVGLLEGVERLGAAAPGTHDVLSDPPRRLRRIDLGAFGVDPSGWSTPAPEVLSWSKAYSLTHRETVCVPTRIAFYAAALPDAPFVQESSNGCAIGGTDAEAQLFGLLEAVERDAFLIAWYGGISLTEIDPRSIQDGMTRMLSRRMRLSGQDVRFFDATVGLPIPTVIAVSESADGATCVGAGSHLDPARALRSALVEVASDFQVARSHLVRRRPELERMIEDFSLVRTMEDHADMFSHPLARPFLSHWLDQANGHYVPLDSLRRHADGGRSVSTDLALALIDINKAGLEAVAVPTPTDLSRRLGAACWRVLIPGLIPVDFGWAHQRALHMRRLSESVTRDRTKPQDDFRPHLVPHPFP